MDALLADALTGVVKGGRRQSPDAAMKGARFQFPGLVTSDTSSVRSEFDGDFDAYPLEARRQAGRVWTVLARASHGTVASFGQLGVHLLSLGASPSMVRRTHEAALETLEAARKMLELGNALMHETWRFGASMAESTQRASHAGLARDACSLLVSGQGLIGLSLHRRLEEMQPLVRSAARGVAESSGAQVLLAWDIVGFALKTGRGVGHTLLKQLEATEEKLMWEQLFRGESGDVDGIARSLGAISDHGMVDVALDFLRDVVRPGVRLLMSGHPVTACIELSNAKMLGREVTTKRSSR